MSGLIAIAGSLAQRPGHGGHTWVFLQYLLGLRRLGWDVLFLDELQPEMCVNRGGQPCRLEDSFNLAYFLEVMKRFGLGNSFSLNYHHGERIVGASREEVLERVGRSAFLLNVMGFLSDPNIMAAAPRRVFLDIDPGFGQMWRELGQADIFAGHDDFVTIGENIGTAASDVPTCGLTWLTTRQPIVLEHWPVPMHRPEVEFSTVASWRGPFAAIEYKGRRYGLRAHEFRKFVTLPTRVNARFTAALDIHPAETRDLELLRDNHWSLLDPRSVARDPRAYQDFIASAWAEFMVAKGLYVETQGGWFSDRSICYLASGKPVLGQDTGLKRHYPTGMGLVPFSTLEEAVAGAEAITRDYARHSQAAREIAVEYFNSNKVLGRLLAKLQVA